MIQQLRVKLDNRPGALRAMVAALGAAGVDMKALEVSARGGGDRGEAHLIVSDVAKALAALSEHEVEVEDALAVELNDQVGGLTPLLDVLLEAEINIQQLYAFVTRVEGKSLAVLTVDDLDATSKLLTEREFKLASRQSVEAAPKPDRTTLSEHLGQDFFW